MGVPQGAVGSPVVFYVHTETLTTPHSRLLKYADDFVMIFATLTANFLIKRGWMMTFIVL